MSALPLSLAERAEAPPGWVLVERAASPRLSRHGIHLSDNYVGSTVPSEAVVVSTTDPSLPVGQWVMLSGLAGDPIHFGLTEERTLYRIAPYQAIAKIDGPAPEPVETESDPLRGAFVPDASAYEPKHAEGDPGGLR